VGGMPARGQVFSTPPKEVLDALLIPASAMSADSKNPTAADSQASERAQAER